MKDVFAEMAEECIGKVDELIKDKGPRLAGSASDLATAEILGKELGSICGSSGIDRFDVHPGVFFSYMKIVPLAYLAGFGSLFLPKPWTAVAIALLALGTAMMVSIFCFYRHGFDRFFKKAQGANAWGVLEPKGEAKRQLIVSGHHDSACIMRIFQGPFSRFTGPVLLGPYIFVVIELAFMVLRLAGIAGPSWPALAVLGLGIPVMVAYFLVVDVFHGGPGAGDNLVSSVMAIRMARYLREERPDLLEGTRLWVVSFDAEEAGLRGSAEFFSRHAEEFRGLPTYHLNFDSLYLEDELHLITKDLNGIVPLDPAFGRKVMESAEACGIRLRPFAFAFPFGGTDAAESARHGLASATVVGQSTEVVQEEYVYHTDRDRADRIERGAVAACMRLIASLLETMRRE